MELVGVGFRFGANRQEHEDIAGPGIEAAPRAAPGARPELTDRPGTADGTLVRERQAVPERFELVQGAIHGVALGGGQAVQLRANGRVVTNNWQLASPPEPL